MEERARAKITRDRSLIREGILSEVRKFCLGIVDDDHDTRQFLRVFFEDVYVIREFSSAQEFLACPDGCDLVLSDLSMPEMDGFELLAKMRSARLLPRIPIIAMTAHAAPVMRAQALAAGFRECFLKPFDLSVLAKAIEDNLPECSFHRHTARASHP